MGVIAIKAEALSKQYRLGSAAQSYQSLRDVIMQVATYPLRTVRGLGNGRLKGSGDPEPSLWAAKDISFEIQHGEIVGIIGRNGAGKSTLLKLLSRITEPSSGWVELRGRIGTLLEVGTGFHPELTGRENVFLNGAILGMGMTEIRRKFDDIVTFAEVEKFIDTPVKHYSTGMAVRLGFSVAAHLEPDILLIDEVLAVGDAGFQKKCLGTMGALREKGRTVLFVSHNLAAIENHCSRTIWIDEGRIREDGRTSDVVKKYLASFGSEQDAYKDLRTMERQKAGGAIRYTGLEFLNGHSGQEIVRTGERMALRLHYTVTEPVSYPYFGVEIYNELGTMIASLNTWSSGYEVPLLSPGDGFIDLEVDSLTLMPSQYYLSVWLAGVGPRWHDKIDRCASFDVEARDYYGSGRGVERKFGLVVFPCRWGPLGDGHEHTNELETQVSNTDCQPDILK
ncbi:ABC transporter related protein [Nitrospira japonica]|uniref:ABC transporter related protein n=1 Tax=Nitrospira japonica TaxID=1325564 RepID=A0A1W1IAG1_9BACT|nr:ABC transporter ATP-binding protein [Nitrospira japonica]SLM49980.1 ABC transporter related protein [Nitrospira japonica]